MVDGAIRWAAAHWWRLSGQARRNRVRLYGGSTGLRVLCMHQTPPAELERFRRLLEWCRERFEIGTPADADDLAAGRWRPRRRDSVLFTFDDGFASNHAAARLLEREGVQAIFFVVPTLVDRSVGQFLRWHAERGVEAFGFPGAMEDRGLSASQVREVAAMGHRIGAHNFAHRDLGRLHTAAELAYEIGNALDAVGELTGSPCADFAVGFGLPHNLSPEAAAHLLAQRLRVYLAHRGLNVPGRTSRFLMRHAHSRAHPEEFTHVCLEGGADHGLVRHAQDMARRVGCLDPGTAGHSHGPAVIALEREA